MIRGILQAADHIVDVPEREAWNYGWAYADYRRSPRAAMAGRAGSVTIQPCAIDGWEAAVTHLLDEPAIQARWDAEEFWSVVVSLTLGTSRREPTERATFARERLRELREAGPAFTINLVANVAWGDRPPLVLRDGVVGTANKELLLAAHSIADGRTVTDEEKFTSWFQRHVSPVVVDQDAPTAIGCWTVGQAQKAITGTDLLLRDVTSLPLLFEHDLAAHAVYRRGNVNRPGPRGVTLDRSAVERALARRHSLELASFPITTSQQFGTDTTARWYSTEPLPLGALLSQPYLRDVVTATLDQDDPIARRLRVAARWFAEAHYTSERDDAALALGISIDALLSGQRSLSGSELADRYAALGVAPDAREARRKKFRACYRVRSAVAHGGQSTILQNAGFLDGFFALVHDAAWRLVAMKKHFRPASEAAVDEVFEQLSRGAKEWPSP